MNRIVFAARAIFLGLLTTQILATLHVYLSNAELSRTVTVITEAGFLAIPNQRVANSLKDLQPAFFGGIFFSLSIGAGLSVLSLSLAWLWDRLFHGNKVFLIPLVALWLGTLIAVNSQGFSPMVAAYFIAVPPVVFISSLHWMPREGENRVWLNRLTPLLPIVLLTTIWAAHADRFLFLDIRDYLLLSNPVGRKVDSFYYRYTLYPAEAFKTLEQKTLKTCSLAAIKDKAIVRRMESALTDCDYLPVATGGPVDLEVVDETDALTFKHHGRTILRATEETFLSRPKDILRQFSVETDRYGLFRQATILCLLVGFPVFLYVMVFAFVHFVSRFFVGPTRCSMVAAVACFLIGLALLTPLCYRRSAVFDATDVGKALDSEHWQQRVSALRTVVGQGLEIGRFKAYRGLLGSPHLPERYWLARTLGSSRDPKTYGDLLAFLDDPHPNVVSMTFHALGQRQNRGAVKEILKRIKTSDHWYNQWYAYRALKALGWKQQGLQ